MKNSNSRNTSNAKKSPQKSTTRAQSSRSSEKRTTNTQNRDTRNKDTYNKDGASKEKTSSNAKQGTRSQSSRTNAKDQKKIHFSDDYKAQSKKRLMRGEKRDSQNNADNVHASTLNDEHSFIEETILFDAMPYAIMNKKRTVQAPYLVSEEEKKEANEDLSSLFTLTPYQASSSQAFPSSFSSSSPATHTCSDTEKKGNIILETTNNTEENFEPIAGFKPEILAPAGDTQSFLAAIAAGADAVYVGLKHFSARAGADNFSMTELSRMVNLANEHGRKVNIAFNSLVKPNDVVASGRLMKRLARDAKPNAIIIQDPGLIDIARQAGFEGEIHLSTLANITHPRALENAYTLGADRVILPREINIDEVRQVAKTCPQELSLELFIHGALCYCVSGRCYWSSYMGGKSGLRGRCVQPCRRVYKQKSREGRYFSSQDLSLDVLVKSLLSIEKVNCWKIEGRKKGPHYVYHAITAYKLLRDESTAAKKEAEGLLSMALARPSTHGIFLPQNPQKVTAPEDNTGSGLLVGKIQFDVVEDTNPKNTKINKAKQATKNDAQASKTKAGKNIDTRQNISLPYFKPRIPLLQKDLIRIGYEDDPWYSTVPITRSTPKAGSYTLRLPRHKTPKAGTPVYLIDRREPDLIKELMVWEKRFANTRATQSTEVDFTPHLPKPCGQKRALNIRVRAQLPQGKDTRAARSSLTGLWLSPSMVRAVSKTLAPRISWWLPPVIWTNEEHIWQRTINEAIRNGATHFVCNEPWQIAFFEDLPVFQAKYAHLEENAQMVNNPDFVKKGKPNSPSHKVKVPRGGKNNKDNSLHLIAGPFCNIANAATIALMKNMGFDSAIVSPELSKNDFLLLPRQSSLPLGFVIEGFWPMGISRHEPMYLRNNMPFTGPKGEQFWTRKYGQNLWIYPSWPLDLTAHRNTLEQAGYSFFVTLEENCPQEQERQASEFNWNIPLL